MPVAEKRKWIPRKQFLAEKFNQATPIQYVDYEPRGACKEIFTCKAQAFILAGSAGTGKSRACLEKANWVLEKYPMARGMMARLTRRSLTQSGMITFQDEVLGNNSHVQFHGGDQAYKYPNGSILGVAGLDDPNKIFSSQWDFIFIQQAEELTVNDWESLFRGLRNDKVPYQQVYGDCNPGPPDHWIRSHAAEGRLVLIESRHEDNKKLWDNKLNTWTPFGVKYIAILDALTGVRYKRLRLGQWAGAEGTVYEKVWDRAIHVIPRFTGTPDGNPPIEWPRYWSIDFGYTNPFSWAAWAEDPDGRLYMYKEIYMTQRPTEDHARAILNATTLRDAKPRAIICDHDAGERATLERHLNGMKTIPAWKSVSAGIQACTMRLQKAGDNKPRVFFLRDSLVELDTKLLAEHHPTCGDAEFESYVWDVSNTRKVGEEPLKKYDHFMDNFRYLIAYVDKIDKKPKKMFPIISIERNESDRGSALRTSFMNNQRDE